MPVIDGTLAWATCELQELIAGGDHTIAIGKVTALGLGTASRCCGTRGATTRSRVSVRANPGRDLCRCTPVVLQRRRASRSDLMAFHLGINKRHLLAMLALPAGVAAGCGSSTTTTGAPTVNVSLTAPSYGAVVGVQDIDVVGLVAPNSAVVRVDRVRAHVANKGGFKSNLTLHPGMNRIRIVATAHGYKRATVSVSLRYHPRRVR